MLDVAQLVPTLEAAREIGVSSRTLARWAREGTVQPTLVTAGGQYRWDVAELERQLRERRQTKDASPPFASDLADAPRHPEEPT